MYSVCASKPVVIAWDALIMCGYVQAMVDIVKHGLNDENQKVKTITALTVSALAEAASPYGIESFDDVLEPLWKGIRLLRGKVSCCLMFSLYPVNCQLVCMQHSAPDCCNGIPSAVSFGRLQEGCYPADQKEAKRYVSYLVGMVSLGSGKAPVVCIQDCFTL